MRDDFRSSDVRLLAERAGFRCSNPNCLLPTVGPDGGAGRASVGVAAHITAAAAGGPRYDAGISTAERASAENGIWLCQTCSRLIDSDRVSYSGELLRDWKGIAEARAFLALRKYDVVPTRSFDRLEAKMPDLIEEMRRDLSGNPFVRRFIAISRKLIYNGGSRPEFAYFEEDHEHLIGKLQVCEKYGATVEVHLNKVPRWEFTEDFVDYLESTSKA
jgi:hypothetical protein